MLDGNLNDKVTNGQIGIDAVISLDKYIISNLDWQNKALEIKDVIVVTPPAVPDRMIGKPLTLKK